MMFEPSKMLNIEVHCLQGSDSLASWQANLFFDPTKFEVCVNAKLWNITAENRKTKTKENCYCFP